MNIQKSIDKGKGPVMVKGWIYRERKSNKFCFLVVRDADNIIQCIVKRDSVTNKIWDDATSLLMEASVEISGEIYKDERAPSGYEINVEKLKVIHNPNPEEPFPITKDQSPEFLLDNRHLWLRSRKMNAIMKIRSTYGQAREEFFKKEGFYRFDTPILQPNQSEGGSTVFEVKYYNQKTYLAQTWQLYGESAVFSLEKVYNTGPTFRAEKSKTSRHLSEFWMVETEVAWWGLREITEFAKKELKYCIRKVAEDCPEEFKLLDRNPKELIEMTKKKWPTIKYREVLKILSEKDKMKVKFGKDLRTIEEESLMKHFNTPVVVTHYPQKVMAFYKPKDPENPDEALCFDMLCPEVGLEIVGGSQRSLDIKEMSENLRRDGEDPENYGFYFDLRKYGSVPHSGYGVGLERVIQWICKLDNIKDAIAFPRTMLRWKP